MSVSLPAELSRAVEEEIAGSSAAVLARGAQDLSARYRFGSVGQPIARGRADALAYAATRLPATFTAAMKAMEAVALQRPDWRPASALDVGVGVGAASWAAVSRWPSLERLVGIDAEPAMLALGSTLRAGASHPALRGASWSRGRAEESSASIGRFDLVLLSYVLGELPEPARTEVVARAWAACAGTLIVVEPGTPAGYRNVLAARARVAGSGGWTTAPCPHDRPCPMSGGDWCHFAARVARSRVHRSAKLAELSHEDEKFSYVALSVAPTSRVSNRVIRHPQVRRGHVYLELCGVDGLERALVSRRDREAFRRARKASWGDGWEPGAAGVARERSQLEAGEPTAPEGGG